MATNVSDFIIPRFIDRNGERKCFRGNDGIPLLIHNFLCEVQIAAANVCRGNCGSRISSRDCLIYASSYLVVFCSLLLIISVVPHAGWSIRLHQHSELRINDHRPVDLGIQIPVIGILLRLCKLEVMPLLINDKFIVLNLRQSAGDKVILS